MWNTISRLFAKGSSKTAGVEEEAASPLPTTTTAKEDEQQRRPKRACNGVADDDAPADGTSAVHVFYDAAMDRGASADDRRRPAAATGAAAAASADQQSSGGDSEHFSDAYESRQAKQRASVKWLLSKAYNNRVPEKLRDPYYRDHEEQEHLKPQIVHTLSNAELYCLALANIYSDPNYHNQNHYGILQALARKGVYVAEQNNTQLTETILIQNSPLKMSAHMAVIEGLMVLYAKEVVTGDRVVSAIRRFDPQVEVDMPSDHEKGLLLWINHASHALIAKIQSEEGGGDKTRLPELPAAKDFQSLCDGVGLAAVVAFYCPGELNWMEIRVSKRPSVADALHNLSLVHAFCVKCLPYSIFHMQPEDVTYMRGSMKQNLVVFLADMYNVLEIHPAKCVRYPGEERAMQYLDACPRNSHGVAHKRSLPQSIAPIPDLRSNLSVSAPGFTVTKSTSSSTVKKSQSLQQTAESHPYDDRRAGSEESFVVHRGKGIPTLSSVADEKSTGRTEAAGRPSNWEDQRRSSYAGRRSRRNSITDDSQLTIENFGGSQDNLHNFGRNPDKELGAHTGKRSTTEPTLPARSSVQDVYGSGVQHIIADNGYSGGEEPPTRLRRQASNSSLDNVALRQILHSSAENDSGADTGGGGGGGGGDVLTKFASFANLSRQSSEKGINFTYTEQDDAKSASRKHGQSNGNGNSEKKTTFATLPNTTTWQQQSNQQSQQMEQHSVDENGGNTVMASQLNNIRLKLEEKRRHIENEKRRMEVVMSKQRQKVGKAAFLQAVTKVHRISQLISESPEPKRSIVHHIPISCESPTEKRQVTTLHSPVPAPPADDMKPQNISFIGNDDDIAQGIRGLNITSGSRTYRIPSPTRPTISQNSFQPHPSLRETVSSRSATPDVTPLDPTDANEKGFYISFDNDAPKKPKPTLRVKRTSPKKERSVSSYIEHENFTVRPESPPASALERQKQMEAQRELERERLRQADDREQQRQEMRDRELKREMERERQREKQRDSSTEGRHASGVGLVIGNQLTNPDPNSMDEMEKKKERIMLMSLQRRQRQEEIKERKEAETQARREQEKLKAEERARKKEEERQRRAAILEHHKVKKAIEEAEREGKVIDKELLNAINPAKLRNKTATARPRPKTIHGDAGAVLDSGALTPSRGKKGSSSNLSTASLTSPTMRRDYYRGSQDSLTAAHLDDRRCSGPLYRGGSLRVSSVDSPDDGRGSSPCRSVNQLGRRGSYKTSRDVQESQQQVRGRPKYQTYQNFKGRKSNSLMNLCDSDSGLGRSTPPRRAASPGIGSMRHLTSPSGPGSLPPALMTSKKRIYDDGSSDISSTPSSMMDYNGPRLYKLPIAKSNRNIMLNAVEYCVFPGTVNREAKSRVLEEIGRSESKHFLILFRDAGCQFRALYSYCPEREEIAKLYGTGPKQVIDNMFDKFFKYNSSGKCFSQVHTKHLTVTIDAFTIHNSLWQGKKVNLPNKKDIPLVI
ncbi:calmodulin-regulated spectrin-associated protein patronin isoform X12 [Temnothorax americanus]|uniref:calmodulin-regulated spectrin-associated protein patronin isoform X12 n=1 Tax=Temnothorax americanus TaxID=1964332 RepID=UPI0040697B9E